VSDRDTKAELPPSWFVQPLLLLAASVHENTGLRAPGLLALDVSADLGLRLGLAPGESMQIAAGGRYLTVRSRKTP
jgi:hypothetical protein